MDRYGEIYTTYQMILDGAAQAPEATILANGDSPIFNSKDTPNPLIYYGFNHQADHEQFADPNTDGVLCPHCQHILHYKMITYANLGKYYCPNCDFKRPELAYQLTQLGEMTNVSSVFTVDEESYKIEVDGLYNIYNALTAAAVGQHYGVSPEKIRLGLSYDEKVFGRQEVITIGSKKCTLVLVKNPVGLNQVIDTITLSPNDFSLVCLLNANYADGLDVSWIWDGSYEHLTKRAIPQVVTGGDRREDMTFRLQVAGLAEETIHECANLDDVIAQIPQLPTEEVYILATYTAVLQLRQKLTVKGIVKAGN